MAIDSLHDLPATIELPDGRTLYKHTELKVSSRQRPVRLDFFVGRWLRGYSRTLARKAILMGAILVNGQTKKVSYQVRPSDQLALMLPYPPHPPAEPEDIPLVVLFEDEHIIVLDKQPGMVCHPSPGHSSGTLIHALLFHFAKEIEAGRSPEDTQPHLVHRLDRYTSGVMVVAKNSSAVVHLSKQMMARDIKRKYEAIVWGNLVDDKGTITGHIGRDLVMANRWAVFPDGSHGRHATTHYEVQKRYSLANHIHCRLETGRTHQIRLHLSLLDHPLIGDPSYGGASYEPEDLSSEEITRVGRCLELMKRQALHAKTLGFTHPATGEWMDFETSAPKDFIELCRILEGTEEE